VTADQRYAVLGAVRSKPLRDASALRPRRDDGWRERVHRIDEHVACVSCGVVPDARQLLRALQRLANEHRRAWGVRAPVGLVAARLSDYVQAATLRAANRPFGAAFLIAGYDDDARAVRVYLTDPAGFYDEYEGVAAAGDAPKEARDGLLGWARRSEVVVDAPDDAASDAVAPDSGVVRDARDASGARRVVRDALRATLEKEQKRAPPSGGVRVRPVDVEIAIVEVRDDGTAVARVLSADAVAALLADDADDADAAAAGSPPASPSPTSSASSADDTSPAPSTHEESAGHEEGEAVTPEEEEESST